MVRHINLPNLTSYHQPRRCRGRGRSSWKSCSCQSAWWPAWGRPACRRWISAATQSERRREKWAASLSQTLRRHSASASSRATGWRTRPVGLAGTGRSNGWAWRSGPTRWDSRWSASHSRWQTSSERGANEPTSARCGRAGSVSCSSSLSLNKKSRLRFLKWQLCHFPVMVFSLFWAIYLGFS